MGSSIHSEKHDEKYDVGLPLPQKQALDSLADT
jgi:hypothetical protein